jgi:hypothetical protein
MLISKETAERLAFAWREIEVAEGLLKDISKEVERRQGIDIRDAFGRRQKCLQLGVPTGETSHRLFDVPWTIARPIIELHIAEQRALIEVLSAQAISAELDPDPSAPAGAQTERAA